MPSPIPSPRRLLRHALVVVVVAGCVAAGLWQLRRLDDRRAHNALVAERLARPPVSLDAALADPAALAYRRVEAEGAYDAARQALLVGRSLEGEPGNHVLGALVTADGRAIAVDRGWVPARLDRVPVPGAEPPTGTVRVRGVLFPVEPEEPAEQPRSEVATVGAFVADAPAAGRYELHPGAYLWLQDQDPAGGDLPVPAPLPELSEGPHLSYAVQWFLFATIGVVGYAVFLRRERRPREAVTTRLS